MSHRRLLTAYGGAIAAMVALSALVVRVAGVRAQGDPGIAFAGDGLLDGLVRYDSGWYYGIAKGGYAWSPGIQSNVAFFPAYPLAVRVVSWATSDVMVAGMIVTAVCGALFLVGCDVWCRDRGLDQRARVAAIAVVMTWPYAWYLYGVVYSDALFLAAAVWAMVAIGRDRAVWAGLAGAVASAARPTGVAVIAALVITVLERRRRTPRPRDLGVLLSFGGLGGFMAYLQVRFGRPLLFSEAQREWGQGLSWDSVLKRQYWWDLTHLQHRSLVATLTLQAILVVGVVAAVPWVVRRFGWGAGALVVCMVLLPALGSRDFQGSGRYLLGAFPALIVVGERLSQRHAHAVVVWRERGDPGRSGGGLRSWHVFGVSGTATVQRQ